MNCYHGGKMLWVASCRIIYETFRLTSSTSSEIVYEDAEIPSSKRFYKNLFAFREFRFLASVVLALLHGLFLVVSSTGTCTAENSTIALVYVISRTCPQSGQWLDHLSNHMVGLWRPVSVTMWCYCCCIILLFFNKIQLPNKIYVYQKYKMDGVK